MDNLYVYSFISRNKDNKDVKGFRTRSKSILAYEEDFNKIEKEFKQWAAAGVPGEKTRLYRTLNSRSAEKIKENFMIHIIRNHPPMTTEHLSKSLASIAMKAENRAESMWIFDFDVDEEDAVDEFIEDIKQFTTIYWDENQEKIAMLGMDAKKYKTPNGYAVVVPHGFDTRNLLEKWKEYDITLKKDDLLFLDIVQKEVE